MKNYEITVLPYTENMRVPGLLHMDAMQVICSPNQLQAYKRRFVAQWGILTLTKVKGCFYPTYVAVYASNFTSRKNKGVSGKLASVKLAKNSF